LFQRKYSRSFTLSLYFGHIEDVHAAFRVLRHSWKNLNVVEHCCFSFSHALCLEKVHFKDFYQMQSLWTHASVRKRVTVQVIGILQVQFQALGACIINVSTPFSFIFMDIDFFIIL
jgi:hypothetical protein